MSYPYENNLIALSRWVRLVCGLGLFDGFRKYMVIQAEKYTKPPVVEIICQFRFSLKDDWNSKKPGELLKVLTDYPNLEPTQSMGLASRKEDGTTQLTPPTMQYVYSNDSNCSVIITEGSFAFLYRNIDQYTSWEATFEPLLMDAWKNVCKCLSIQEITSIGVRYINHIVLSADFSIVDAFKSNKHLPEKIITAEHAGVFSRSEIALDNNNVINITMGTGVRNNTFDHNSDNIVLLDIDRVITDNIDISESTISSKLMKLHDDISEIFFSIISDKLKEKMG